MDQQTRNQSTPAPGDLSIVGAWRIDAEGAPFVPHVALFHSDGTCLLHNPDAGNPHTSDSLGVGAWKVDDKHPQTIIGVFEEITADQATHQYVNRLRVTFRWKGPMGLPDQRKRPIMPRMEPRFRIRLTRPR